MRIKIVCLTGLFVLSTTLFACDSTVGLDPTTAIFTKVLVPGVCPLDEEELGAFPDGSKVKLSILLLNGKDSLLPDSKIVRQIRPVGELLPKENFSFSKSAFDADVTGAEPGVFSEILDDLSIDPQKFPTVIQPIQRKYSFAGGESRKDDQRLVVIVMDHSGTLAGLDPNTGGLNPGIRTDQRDERITFFTQLVSNLPPQYKVAVVRMNDQDSKVEDCLRQNFDPCEEPRRLCSVGFKEPDPVRCALKSLEAGEKGKTPLNDTLKEVFDLLLTRSYPEDNPIVIVFTDGLEDGDASQGYEVGTGKKIDSPGFNDVLAEGQARDLYKAGVNKSGSRVPIIVMHLQPPTTSTYPRGRDATLQELACTTGGEYIFLEGSDILTKSSNLQSIVRNRIRGAWQLNVDTSLSQSNFEVNENGYLLSTTLQVTLGGVQRTADLSQGDSSSGLDNRLWLKKY